MLSLASLSSVAEDAVEQFGAAGLFAIMLIEHVFPPIPSELVLPLAGYEISRGAMSFVTAILAATAGSLAGALVLYAIARRGGRPAILRLQRLLRVDEAALDRAEASFDRRGTWIVFGGRMVPGVRSLVSVPPGLLRMPLRRYLALTLAGSLLWNTLLILIGMQLGNRWDQVEAAVAPVATVMAAVAVLGGSVAFVLWRRRRAPAPSLG